jgi:hypothetical protein
MGLARKSAQSLEESQSAKTLNFAQAVGCGFTEEMKGGVTRKFVVSSSLYQFTAQSNKVTP